MCCRSSNEAQAHQYICADRCPGLALFGRAFVPEQLAAPPAIVAHRAGIQLRRNSYDPDGVASLGNRPLESFLLRSARVALSMDAPAAFSAKGHIESSHHATIGHRVGPPSSRDGFRI